MSARRAAPCRSVTVKKSSTTDLQSSFLRQDFGFIPAKPLQGSKRLLAWPLPHHFHSNLPVCQCVRTSLRLQCKHCPGAHPPPPACHAQPNPSLLPPSLLTPSSPTPPLGKAYCQRVPFHSHGCSRCQGGGGGGRGGEGGGERRAHGQVC